MSKARANAQAFRSEAFTILQSGVLGLLEYHLGHVEIVGSVALDPMAVPDIDLYVRLEASEAAKMLGSLPDLAAQLREQGYKLAKIVFNAEHLIPDPAFPDSPGPYSGLTFVSRGSSRVWKMDLWGRNRAFYDVRHTQHKALQTRLQGANWNLILRLKGAEGFGRRFFSVDVYDFALRGRGSSLEAFEGGLLGKGPS